MKLIFQKLKNFFLNIHRARIVFAEERERERETRRVSGSEKILITFTVGRKIGFAFLVVLILMGVMAGVTFQGFDKVISSFRDVELETVKRGDSGNLRFSIAQLLMASNDYIITEKEYYHREYSRLNSRADDFYRQFIQLSLTDEERRLVSEIKQDLDSIRAISEQIFSIQHPRQSPEAWTLMETMDYRFGDDANRKTTEIFDGISGRIEQNRRVASAVKKNASNSIYGITFLAIVIGVVVIYLTVQRISKPIITVTKAANGIANGDYSQRPVVKTHDEVAVLAQSFSRMAESIQQSQRALEESKRFTENIVATVPSGLLVIGKPARQSRSGGDSEVLSINRSFCELFNVTRQQVVGQPVDALLQTIGLSQKCRDAISARMPFRNLECACSIPGKGELTLNLTLSGIRLAEEEEEEEDLIVIDDITESKRAELQMRLLSSAVEQTSDCVVITDREGTIQYVNPASEEQTGYSREEALGKTPRIIKSGKYTQRFYEGLWQTILSGTSFRARFVNRRKNGELYHVEKTITPLKDNHGNITHFVDTSKDITKHIKAEEAFRKHDERYKTAIENIFKFVPEGILAFTGKLKLFNRNKTFEDIVQTYSSKLEYTEQELAEIIIAEVQKRLMGEIGIHPLGTGTTIRIQKKATIQGD